MVSACSEETRAGENRSASHCEGATGRPQQLGTTPTWSTTAAGAAMSASLAMLYMLVTPTRRSFDGSVDVTGRDVKHVACCVCAFVRTVQQDEEQGELMLVNENGTTYIGSSDWPSNKQ
jgi:hypothetical protein